jgi:oxygen-independent coproporphyrinogen III oxidase
MRENSDSPQPLVDPSLIARYDLRGPRYTSYPTTPQFRSDFGEAALRRHLWQSNVQASPRPLSLYFHIPYCTSPCFYCGCNREITRDPAKGEHYLERLLQEIRLVAPLVDVRREILQLHLGGGTPNFLRPEQLARLMSALACEFRLSSSLERDYSIELDPRLVQAGDIGALRDLGFNRVSLGIQDFDPRVQQAVNRVQDPEETLRIIAEGHRLGLRSVNVDLIYGLPRQTLTGFARTLDMIVESRPERLAVYGYAHMPALFKAQRHIAADELPGPQERLSLLRLAIERIGAAGYCHIGMDHFALPTDDLSRARATGTLQRNFMGYTTHAGCDLIGFGVSAISHIGSSFSQNHRHIRDWEDRLDRQHLPVARGLELTPDDHVRADVIQQLMCQGRVDFRQIERLHGIRFAVYFADELQHLEPLIADELAIADESGIRVTPRGQLLVRHIAMRFDRYVDRAAVTCVAALSRFSKIL